MTQLPLVKELRPAPDAVDAFRRLCHCPQCLFLDSALREPQLGRYSFVVADPFDYLQLPTSCTDSLDQLQSRLDRFLTANIATLPTFQGGAAGLLSYDL